MNQKSSPNVEKIVAAKKHEILSTYRLVKDMTY